MSGGRDRAGGSLYSKIPGPEGRLGLELGGPYIVRSHVRIGGSLYSEVQCIMGNGHMGTLPL